MTGAMQEVLEESMNYGKAYKAYKFPQITLEWKVKEVRQKELSSQVTVAEHLGRYKTVFFVKQEKKLVDRLLNLDEKLFGVALSELKTVAFELAEKHNSRMFLTWKRESSEGTGCMHS